MNETLKVIHSRRSVRQFRDEQIADEEIRQIVEAAIYAPNARNQQMWHFAVVQNREMLIRMVAITKENIMNSGNEFLIGRASVPDYHTFHHAPTAVLIAGDANSKFVEIDCGAAAQNITLAAKSLNIGSCVIAQSEFLFMSEKGDEIKKAIGVPDGYKHICAVALGYLDGENPDMPLRKKDVITYLK